ncbi:MAG: peptidoglycan-binding domain-containing protein, partial [Deltaproteobacteria bacterium]
GPNTEKAVIQFQQKNGLVKDGQVGKNTWGKLCALYKEKNTVQQQPTATDLEQLTATGQNPPIATGQNPPIAIKVDTKDPVVPQVIQKNKSPLSSNITIKTYVPTTGQPLPFTKLEVKTCTQKGSINTDGHIHDRGTNDPCFKSDRPHSSLNWYCCSKSGGTLPQRSGNPINVVTDSNGIAKISYTPPSSTDAKNKYYIAGKDQIIVTLTSDPSIKNDTEYITTKVNGLKQMFNSTNCSGDGRTFFFEKQTNHGCIFYGTPSTNDAILRIANDFVQKQIDCKNSPKNQCTIIDDKGKNRTITIKGEPIPIKITAMNLPWGGLSDIKGSWNPPHKSHYSGKEIDIGFGNLKLANGQFDMDRIHLLRYVSSKDSNFRSFVSDEGGNIAQTMATNAPHIHIFFSQ